MSGETEKEVSGWTVDTLHSLMVTSNDGQSEMLQRQLDDLRVMLNERYATQVKAVDAAFLAQQTAMQTALSAAEKAVECVSADTPVLCADLTWRPAGDLLVGDELIAFDEDDPGTPRGRRFRRSVVTGNAPKRDALLSVVTTRGNVRCNRQHPFLARFPRERWRWVRAEDLRGGEEVMHAVDVWERDQSWSGGWLAGMYDGEGCLTFASSARGKARLSIVQTVGGLADALEVEIKDRCETAGVRRRPATKYKAKTEIEINARVDIMRMLGSIRPMRLLAKADAVWDDFPISGNARAATVTSVENAGTGMIASLSTSTGTYIAAGFAMHNTALLSAEKAVAKAELAADKRFEAVNEFRAQLADQAASFLPRTESETRFGALGDKVEAMAGRNSERITALEGRANIAQGEKTGSIFQAGDQRAGLQAIVAIGGVLLLAISLAVTIIIAVMP